MERQVRMMSATETCKDCQHAETCVIRRKCEGHVSAIVQLVYTDGRGLGGRGFHVKERETLTELLRKALRDSCKHFDGR